MKHFNRISNYLLPFTFMILLGLPFVNGKMKIWEFERRDENRSFKDSLSIDINRLDIFPAEFESYLNDNFSFRTPLLNLYHEIKFDYFKTSAHPEKTIVGKENWFFIAQKEKEIFEGRKDFSESELNDFLTEWKSRKNYLEAFNIKLYWVIAPFKHYVYSEYLPFSIYNADSRRVDQLKGYFEKNLPGLIIDPLPLLIESKGQGDLYYRLDNHWNYHSGYIVTQQLLKRLKHDFPNKNIPDIPIITWQDTILRKGFHYSVIGIESLSEQSQIPLVNQPNSKEVEKYGFKGVEGFAYPWDFERRYANETLENGLKVLIIRDSFAGQLIPFLPELFKESVFIFDAWQYKMNEDIIEVVKPDVVIFLSLETHLENILMDYE